MVEQDIPPIVRGQALAKLEIPKIGKEGGSALYVLPGIDRDDLGPGGGGVENAVDHDRRGFLAARGVQLDDPGRLQLGDIAVVDLRQIGEALLQIGAAVGQPIIVVAHGG